LGALVMSELVVKNQPDNFVILSIDNYIIVSGIFLQINAIRRQENSRNPVKT
jgi:hypothetical protein